MSCAAGRAAMRKSSLSCSRATAAPTNKRHHRADNLPPHRRTPENHRTEQGDKTVTSGIGAPLRSLCPSFSLDFCSGRFLKTSPGSSLGCRGVREDPFAGLRPELFVGLPFFSSDCRFSSAVARFARCLLKATQARNALFLGSAGAALPNYKTF